MSEDQIERLQIDLTQLVGEVVTVDAVQQHTVSSADLTVCRMRYRISDIGYRISDIGYRISDIGYPISKGDSNQRIQQTAVVFRADDLDVPAFRLSPHMKGLAGKLFSLLGNMGDINFEDSPVFSDNYYLAGCQIEAVRVLFTPELREHLAQQPHWSVQGDGKRLVLSRRNTVIAESEEAAFISDALQVVQLIREGEQCLDERPDLVRETTARALVDSTQNMSGVAGGMLGAMMKRVVEKTAISSDEMTTFLQSTTPRDIPNGMRVQVIGDNLALIVAGIAFACMGFASAIGTCFSQRATPNGWQPAPDCQ